jgi:hypothetical protein
MLTKQSGGLLMVCHCAEFQYCFRFQLTHAFAGHVDLPTDFRKG